MQKYTEWIKSYFDFGHLFFHRCDNAANDCNKCLDANVHNLLAFVSFRGLLYPFRNHHLIIYSTKIRPDRQWNRQLFNFFVVVYLSLSFIAQRKLKCRSTRRRYVVNRQPRPHRLHTETQSFVVDVAAVRINFLFMFSVASHRNESRGRNALVRLHALEKWKSHEKWIESVQGAHSAHHRRTKNSNANQRRRRHSNDGVGEERKIN